jgi:hypothetical protein
MFPFPVSTVQLIGKFSKNKGSPISTASPIPMVQYIVPQKNYWCCIAPCISRQSGANLQHHSEMALTGNPRSIVWIAPLGRKSLPSVAGSKQLVQWTSETWCKCEKCRSSTRPPPPPRKGYGPYRILAVCFHNLWPAVRIELGQEEWLRSPQKPQAKRTYRSW